MDRSTGSPDVEVEELVGELSDELVSELEGDEDNPFDSDGSLVWRDKDRYLILRGPDGRLAAAAGLVGASVTVAGDAPFHIVGLGGVIVRADRRGEGLARTVVSAALERAASLGPDRVVLFCWPDRAGLYARLGFAAVDGPVTVGQPGGASARMHMDTMWRSLAPGATWPPGAVSLDGLLF